MNNNCYNYATRTRDNSFAYPGIGGGKKFKSFTANAIIAAAKLDGLTFLENPGDGLFPDTKGECLVALVVWKGLDCHWFRRDKGGNWSHKPGTALPTNKDGKGQIITDPRSAPFGRYRFKAFMSYCPGNISIQGNVEDRHSIILA